MLVAALLATATSCHHTTDSSTSGFTTLMCDKTFENIIQQEIDVFEYTYPNASIIPYYIDAHSAIDSMLDGNARLIITAQELSKEQMDYLQSKNRFPARSQRIAVDAIAVIVNKDNDIDELSISELRDILSGKTPRWKDVFPSKLDTIRVIFDHPGSSIYKYVKDSIMRGEEFGRIYSVDSLQQVFTEVERRRNAIGFIGVSWITADLANSTTAVEQQEAAATDTAAMLRWPLPAVPQRVCDYYRTQRLATARFLLVPFGIYRAEDYPQHRRDARNRATARGIIELNQKQLKLTRKYKSK